MKRYNIRCDDGEVYSFNTAQEVLEALARALGHEYYHPLAGWIQT